MASRKVHPTSELVPRHESYVRELMQPSPGRGYDQKMPGGHRGTISSEQLERVARFLRDRCTKDQPEGWHVERSGIPQATFSSAKRGKKLGWSTAARLAQYFGWGDDVAGFLNGTSPAGHYASIEGVMPVGYPKRGVVLDRFRGIVAADLLDEVQQIVLPKGSPDWTELDWAKTVFDTVSRWERLGKNVNPTDDLSSGVGGQEPRQRRPT